MNELAKQESLDIDVPQSQPQGVMDLMRLAVVKGDVATLERLEALFDRQNAKQAKREYDTDMASFQNECPVILKTVKGAKENVKFAPLDHIVSQVKPLLNKYGFSYTFDTACEDKAATVTITVKHRAGHAETSQVRVPTDIRNTLMNAAQAVAGAITFAKRYAFANAFGIHVAGDDNDGQTPQIKGDPPRKGDTKALKAELWALLKPVRGDQSDWEMAQRWLVDECAIDVPVSKMTADELKVAINKAKTTL